VESLQKHLLKLSLAREQASASGFSSVRQRCHGRTPHDISVMVSQVGKPALKSGAWFLRLLCSVVLATVFAALGWSRADS
jgi:hypothetical protein